MLRTIASTLALAALMVACGGGDGEPASTPPPSTFAVGGTVSGLVGSGLTLEICSLNFENHHCPIQEELQIGANGTFTLKSRYPANYQGSDVVGIRQQPSSPAQHCVVGNAKINIKYADDNNITVSCASFLYVTNAADNTLSAYLVDPTTGALAAIGAPTATGTSPHAILLVSSALGEDKKYVFVGNEGSNDVSVFAVNNATGELTAAPGSPFPAGTDPQALALYGSYLYVANAGSDNVMAFPIDWHTGALAEPSTVASGKTPTSMVWSYGSFFVANHGGSNDISQLGTGPPPVLGSSFPVGGNPLGLALRVGSGGTFLYSANPDATNPSISGFSIDPLTAALSPLSGSPLPLPVSHFMAVDPTGAFLYVTSGADIVGYGIDANTGALTALAGFPVAAGADAYSISIDPTDRFLYVTAAGAAQISGFTLDASTGALTPMAGSPFATGNHPQFIATF